MATQQIHVDVGDHRVTASSEITLAGGQPINILANPSAWGWPDHTNTGVRGSVTDLTPEGSVTVTTPGTVLRELHITGGLTIRANDVEVYDCLIDRVPSPGFGCVRFQNNPQGVILQNIEAKYLDNAFPDAVIGGNASYALIASNIHKVTEGPRVNGNCVIQDNYIHDLRPISGGHIDCLQVTAGSNILFQHNTLIATGFNACIIVKSDFGPIADVMIRDNVMDGGNYTLYVTHANHPIGPATVQSNRFGRSYQFGVMSTNNVDDLLVASNVWDDNNQGI